MTWFKVDDGFSQHPKVLRIPRAQRTACAGLWVLAGSWCAKNLTDGHLDVDMIEEFCGTKKQTAELIRVGLWHGHDHSCEECPPVPEGGLLFHDWAALQPSRDEILTKRRAEAERKAEWRSRRTRNKSGARPADVPLGHVADASDPQVSESLPDDVPDVSQWDTSRTDGGTGAGVPGVSRSTRPDPTRPVTTKEKTSSSLMSAADAVDVGEGLPTPKPVDPFPEWFDEFYAAYPRKEAKRKAEQAYRAALKRADHDTIMAGLRRFRFPDDRTFTPLPASWLNADRWADEPHLRVATSGGQRKFTNDELSRLLGPSNFRLPQPPPGMTDFESFEWEKKLRRDYIAERVAQAEAKLAGVATAP